jgi:hypothetical protein
METGHEHKAHAGRLAHQPGADTDDLAQPGTRRQTLVTLAMHFTAQTADASLLVLQQVVLTHEPPPTKSIATQANYLATTFLAFSRQQSAISKNKDLSYWVNLE